jgi:hypothetical protein
MIKNTAHCLICENKKIDFTTGVYCSITGEKPKFLEKCSSKDFSETMQQKIFELNYKLKMAQDRKPATMLHLYTFLGFSAAVLIATYVLTIRLWEMGWMSSITITIGAIGLGLIPVAVAPLNKYKRTLKLAFENKKELDLVLNVYNIKYEIETRLIKDVHDSIDIEADLILIKNGQKESFQLKKINVGTTND